MLDGQGADEVLGGYHTYFGPFLTGIFLRLRWLSLIGEVRALKQLHNLTYLVLLGGMAGALLPEWARRALRRARGGFSYAPSWLDMNILQAVPSDPIREATGRSLDLRSASLAELSATRLQMLLHWEDRSSMAHSVESRVPFLDHRLVECVLGMPDCYKIMNGTTKVIMREAMRGILPELVRSRIDKIGFATPEEIWIKKGDPDWFRNSITESVEVGQGVLTPEVVARFERILSGRDRFSFFPWKIISFGSWIRKFKVRV